MRVLLSVLALLTFLAGASRAEPFRPLYHFTPEKNWMNDPNGMVWHDGEWHLFYQYNPFGDKWGHMSWGHAVSRDLLTWEHLPVALAEENGVMIFSGSAVVDEKNTSGFGVDGKPPMVAIYTAHTEKNQSQALAYSNDRGRTWTKYSGNPVLDIGAKDFRDPKVMWHAPTQRWIMTVAWSLERKVRFYASPDLKNWTHLSDFGPAGSITGIWECPDLIPLKVEGTADRKWLLIVNVGSGAPAGGSGGQYFLGDFDGRQFTPHAPRPAGEGARWLDFGPDFYAGVTWSGGPPGDGRSILLGWMSNWEYANDVPTSPWRSAMSVPRELSLRRSGDDFVLIQQPVRELSGLSAPARVFPGGSMAEANAWLAAETGGGNTLDLSLTLSPDADGSCGLDVFAGPDGAVHLVANLKQGTLQLDRTRSGLTDFNPKFRRVAKATLPAREATAPWKLRLLLDACSVEVFTEEGAVALTSLAFPGAESRTVRLTSAASVGPVSLRRLSRTP